MADEWSFGIEEEYFLADAKTGCAPVEQAAERFHEIAAAEVDAASHELLKGQVEVQSEPGVSLDVAHEALSDLRTRLCGIAGDHGMQLFAAGSHPLAEERHQSTTEEDRYRKLEREFGIIGSRSMVCAMHVHVSVPDPNKRIDLMNRVLPFLPLLYALSTGSPFWQGRNTRLKGFRLAAFSEWPRMGLPEIFRDDAQYDTFVERLVKAGAISDASFVWWLIRPSTKYPTLELRICDSCTRVDDAVAIAALYRCLLHAAWRRPDLNANFGPIEHGICAENVWQAQQGGTAAHFVDAASGGKVTVRDALEAALELCVEDAAELDCGRWLSRTRDILERGSSADRQLALYEKGGGGADALRSVVEALAAETALDAKPV